MTSRRILLTFLSFTAVFSPVMAQSGKTPAATTLSKTKVGSLGDLSAFRVILQDTLTLVQSGKSRDAVTRIRAFEVLWDKQAGVLNGRDATKWTTIDSAADVALSAVRSSTSTKTQSVKALHELIRLIDAG